jgi:hypothetical protein
MLRKQLQCAQESGNAVQKDMAKLRSEKDQLSE